MLKKSVKPLAKSSKGQQPFGGRGIDPPAYGVDFVDRETEPLEKPDESAVESSTERPVSEIPTAPVSSHQTSNSSPGNAAPTISLGDSAPVQLEEDPGAEEVLQGEFGPAPARDDPEDEETVQGKFAPAQHKDDPDEEKLLQGKFAENAAPVRFGTSTGASENRTGMPDRLKLGLEQLGGLDLSGVRIHYNSSKPAQVKALAFTQGQEIHIGPGQEKHLPHEGWHAVQQLQGRVKPTIQTKGLPVNEDEGLEHEADVMGGNALQMKEAEQAKTATSQRSAPLQREVGKQFVRSNFLSTDADLTVQRRVSVRDAGRGEQSGLARLDEFVARLNEVSTGLTFRVEDGWLLAEPRDGGTLNEFDRQMQAFIIDPTDIPMRMTNRHGLLGNREAGYHTGIELDTWQSGYVDIDDMLASSPTGFMTSLVHLLRERQQTRNYARRIGSPSLDATQAGPMAEFQRVHRAGLDAELAILRDYLQDPSVRFIDRDTRLLRNDRGDRIRERLGAGTGGIHESRWVVVLRESGRVVTLEEYRELLEPEDAAAQDQ